MHRSHRGFHQAEEQPPTHLCRRQSAHVVQGVFKRIYECLLEDGVVRPEQIVCPPHLPTPQDMQLVRASHHVLRCDEVDWASSRIGAEMLLLLR